MLKKHTKKIVVTMEVEAIDNRGYSFYPTTLRYILDTVLTDAREENWDYTFKVDSVAVVEKES